MEATTAVCGRKRSRDKADVDHCLSRQRERERERERERNGQGERLRESLSQRHSRQAESMASTHWSDLKTEIQPVEKNDQEEREGACL
jgi:hypothetical protein